MDMQQCRISVWFAIILACMLFWMTHGDVLAATPIQTLEGTIDSLQHILRDPVLGHEARTRRVRGIIFSQFDFREMSKRILGPHWGQNTQNQDEFIVAFTGFLERTFFDKIDKIKDAKLVYHHEEIQGSQAKVMANINIDDDEYEVKFFMHLLESKWKIYDMTFEKIGLSLVRSYRAQLNRVLQRLSFHELLQLITAKNIR